MRGTLTGQRYVDDILRPHIGPFLNGLPGAIFQQDNARPHTARVAQDFLRHFQTLPWPARSPDLSPVEHVSVIIVVRPWRGLSDERRQRILNGTYSDDAWDNSDEDVEYKPDSSDNESSSFEETPDQKLTSQNPGISSFHMRKLSQDEYASESSAASDHNYSLPTVLPHECKATSKRLKNGNMNSAHSTRITLSGLA
ncbi:DDE_3 domain-containing protein [Trichonephila clavipes]|nr:DDE_3 domain-containing protein [Trichonephila clavipes]